MCKCLKKCHRPSWLSWAWICYGILWLLYFVGMGIAAYHGWQYRPVTLWIFGLLAGLGGAALLGGTLWKWIKRRWLRNTLLTLYVILLLMGAPLSLLMGAIRMPEEAVLPWGDLEIGQYQGFLEAREITYAHPRLGLFMEPFSWEAADDIRALEYTHSTTFTLAPDQGDGISRYTPEEHPQLAVRVYGVSRYGLTDDYQMKLTSQYAREVYEKEDMDWEYTGVGQYEGAMEFVVREEDDLEAYAADLAKIVARAVEDPFYEREVGYVQVMTEDAMKQRALYFGAHQPFIEEGKAPDTYAYPEAVLPVLEALLYGEE